MEAYLREREREVGALAAQGLTNRQISEGLGISEKTVRVHMTMLSRVIGAESRADVMRWFLEEMGPLERDPKGRSSGGRSASKGRGATARNGAVTEGAIEREVSDREREVGVLVGEDLTNRQIGERLGISEHTVRVHLTTLYRLIGARTRVDVARWFWERRTRSGKQRKSGAWGRRAVSKRSGGAARDGAASRWGVSARQQEVGALVAKGLWDREIADRLGIRTATVKNHVGSLRRAVGAGTRVGVARWFWEHEDRQDRERPPKFE